MKTLSDAEAAERLSRLPGWACRGKEIRRTFTFTSFKDAMAFVNHVADLAEEMDHHPDIDIRYSRVTLALTTHDAGGLTALDFDLAEKAGS